MPDSIGVRDLEHFIGINSNLEVLEDCLDRFAHVYFALQQRKKSLNFGEILTLDGLMAIVPEVTGETRNFLGASDVPDAEFRLLTVKDAVKTRGHEALLYLISGGMVITLLRGSGEMLQDIIGKNQILDRTLPTSTVLLFYGISFPIAVGGRVLYEYYKGGLSSVISSRYNHNEGRIGISANDTVSVVADISHEFTHSIQDLHNVQIGRKYPIAEGHARGVQREISGIFAERSDNPAYVYKGIEQTAKELNDAYLFICTKNHRSPKASLQKLKIPRFRSRLPQFMTGPFEAHHYSIGVAAMCIAEAKHGTRVYRDVINNDYSFLRA